MFARIRIGAEIAAFVCAPIAVVRGVCVQDANAASAEIEGEHALWTKVLADHVDDRGFVDYRGIGEDSRFRAYLEQLQSTSPATLADDAARKTFWINAYNAFVIAGVLSHLPEDPAGRASFNVLRLSPPGEPGASSEPGEYFFRRLKFLVSGRGYSLDEIEKGVLFHRPDWFEQDPEHYRISGIETPDPRIHFALVCAAKGCVKLRREAYERSRIEQQLNDAVLEYVGDEGQARFDRKRRMAELSKIVEWYADDFTSPHVAPRADSVAGFLARFVADAELARSLASETWTLRFSEYDWSLNSQR